jgi:uncharacterized phage protein (TIGR02218 family)
VTYDATEKSAYGGKPVELYRFTQGTAVYRYTDGDRPVTKGTETFGIGWPLSRTEPEISEETTRSGVKITSSKDFPIAQMFITGAPYQSIWVSILRGHADAPSEAILIWQGKVRGVSWKASKGEATIECDPVEKVIGKGGFRQTYGPYCHKELYSARCGVPEASFTTDIVVSAIGSTGFVITAPELAFKPSQYFRLGEVYFPDLGARVLIVDHTGSTVTLRSPILGLPVGAHGRVVAGCNHVWKLADGNWGDCRARFNNTDNFGGWPFVPIKNPYEVTIEG